MGFARAHAGINGTVFFIFINSLRNLHVSLKGLWYAGLKARTDSKADPVNRVPTHVYVILSGL